MALRFTKIRPDTFERIQLNAGILIGDTPSHYMSEESDDGTAEKHYNVYDTLTKLQDATWHDVLGSTTGGVTFEATPEFTDFGEDIDNCPKNMKQLKRMNQWEVTLSGTFVILDPNNTALLIGNADIHDYNEQEDNTYNNLKITKSARISPRTASDLNDACFKNIWWIGDYGSDNSEENGGYLAIHMYNALSTGGFHFTSGDNEKGTFDFEFTAHYDMDDQDKVPFAVYIGSGDLDDTLETKQISTTSAIFGVRNGTNIDNAAVDEDAIIASKDK